MFGGSFREIDECMEEIEYIKDAIIFSDSWQVYKTA